MATESISCTATLATMQPQLVRYCTRTLHSPEDGEDAAQETACKAWQAWDAASFANERMMRAWVWRIARNTCLDLLRARQRHLPPLPLTVWDRDTTDVEAAVLLVLRVEETALLIGALYPTWTPVVIMDAAGYTRRQIAATLGINEGTVASRLFRARHALREARVAA